MLEQVPRRSMGVPNTPTEMPTDAPTQEPTFAPTETDMPTEPPTFAPTGAPSHAPSHEPTSQPTHAPTRPMATFYVPFDSVEDYEDGWETLKEALIAVGVPEEQYSELVRDGDIMFEDKNGRHEYTFSNSRTVVEWPANVSIWVATDDLKTTTNPVSSTCAQPVALALIVSHLMFLLMAA